MFSLTYVVIMLKEKMVTKISTATSLIFPASLKWCEQLCSSSRVQIRTILINLEQKAPKHLAEKLSYKMTLSNYPKPFHLSDRLATDHP